MTARYLLKLKPSQKAELKRKADEAGISVGEYLRSVLKTDSNQQEQQTA